MDRRQEVDPGQGKVNELVWTEVVVDISPKRIVRRCRVVRVEEGAQVPRLADWNGTCDWFFYRVGTKVSGVKENVHMSGVQDGDVEVTTEDDVEMSGLATPAGKSVGSGIEIDPAVTTEESHPSSTSTEPERLGTDLTPRVEEQVKPVQSMDGWRTVVADYEPPPLKEDKKLRGLDLFCGGGNFGRGIADGGAVTHKWFIPLPPSPVFPVSPAFPAFPFSSSPASPLLRLL